MFAFIIKCIFIITVSANHEQKDKVDSKPEIKIGKVVGVYSNLNEAKLDIKRRGIHTVPFIKHHGNPRLHI